MSPEIQFDHQNKGYYRTCKQCLIVCFRKKRSEALKPNWEFCSRKCRMVFRNINDNPCKRPEVRQKLSILRKQLGIPQHLFTKEAREKQRKTISGEGHWNWQGNLTHPKCMSCGKNCSFQTKKCRKCSSFNNRGVNNSRWNPNKRTFSQYGRGHIEIKQWRAAVFKRDNWKCVFCGIKSQKGTGRVLLNADHIKPWLLFPELRFELSNGRTLCIPCHRKTPTYGGKIYKYMKTLQISPVIKM